MIERDGGEGLGKLCHVIYMTYSIFRLSFLFKAVI